ncbi:MAG TPA: glycosyltransferase family 4 protein [Kiritimatiellia bacterium]
MNTNNPLRILIIGHGHPELQIGGGEHAAYHLFNELKRRTDCKPLFLARHGATENAHPGTSFAAHKPDGSEMLFYSKFSDNFLFSQPDGKAVWKDFRSLLEHFKPDVVHFHHYLNLGLEFIREVRNYSARVPIFLTLHEYLPLCHHNGQLVTIDTYERCDGPTPAKCNRCFPYIAPAKFKQRELFIKSFLRLVDCFVSGSEFLTGRYVAWGLPREKIVQLENGQPSAERLPPRPLQPGEQRSRFAYFGQLLPYKGIVHLLRAMALLKERDQRHMSLSVHGANLSWQAEWFKKEYAEAFERASDMAWFKGAFKHADLPHLMAETDWVVVPSIWWENAPLVIQEAFKYGRPVICSNVGGMAEKVRHNVDGLHFIANNVSDMADCMLKAAGTPGLWERLAAATPRPPTIAETVDVHLELYRDQIARRTTRGTASSGVQANQAQAPEYA